MTQKALLKFAESGLVCLVLSWLRLVISGVCLITSMVCLNGSVHAQTEHKATENRISAESKHAITAGALKAEIIDNGHAGPNPAGGSVFIAIKLFAAENTASSQPGKTRGRKSGAGLSATLVLEAENGEIRTISGETVKPRIEPQRATAIIEGLRPGVEKTILVELRLKSIGGDAPDILKVTLADMAGVQSEPVELKWTVKDCSSNYYAELRKLAEAGGAQLGKLIAALRMPDKSLPRSFLFRTTLMPDTGRERRCVKYKRKWNPYEYEWERVCVRYRGGDADAGGARQMSASREEREILAQAAAFIKSGGADPKLSRNTDLGWRGGKIAEDLRIYLEQELNPALCTGAVQFSDYYLKNVSGLTKHADTILSLAARARTLAAAKAEQAKQQAEALPGGHPGIGLVPLSVVVSPPTQQLDAGEADLRQIILNLAPYANLPAETMQQLAAAPATLEMLRIVKQAMDDKKAAADKEMMNAIIPAFAFIEAAAYLNLAGQRYATVKSSFVGSIEGIRAAYDKHCICGG